MEPTASFASILNLGNDILHEICQILNDSVSSSGGQIQKPLHAFSQTNKTLRAISAREIFREIGVICVDWKKAERLVDEMQGCPAITNYTRTFKFNVLDHRPPPRNIPAQLAKLMTPMTNLIKLMLVLPENHFSIFEKAFQESNLSLPEVKTVVVGPCNEFILSILPNVKTVSTNGRWMQAKEDSGSRSWHEHTKKLISAVARAKIVEELEIMEWWSGDIVNSVTDQLPNLRSLALNGKYFAPLDKLLPGLSTMPYLEILALASSANLHIGFGGWPECGNIFFSPDGEEVYDRIAREEEEAENKAASMVLTAFKEQRFLSTLWVGDSVRFEFLRDEDGRLKEFVRHSEQKKKIISYM